MGESPHSGGLSFIPSLKGGGTEEIYTRNRAVYVKSMKKVMRIGDKTSRNYF